MARELGWRHSPWQHRLRPAAPRHRATSCTLGSSCPSRRGCPQPPRSWRKLGAVREQGLARGCREAQGGPGGVPRAALWAGARSVTGGGVSTAGRGGPALWVEGLLSLCPPGQRSLWGRVAVPRVGVETGPGTASLTRPSPALARVGARRSCKRCSCCWLPLRPRAIISRPCSRASCSCCSSVICFSCHTRAPGSSPAGTTRAHARHPRARAASPMASHGQGLHHHRHHTGTGCVTHGHRPCCT